MSYRRQWLIDTLRHIGYMKEADEASRDMPDEFGLDQLLKFAEQHSISRDELVNRMGGSPLFNDQGSPIWVRERGPASRDDKSMDIRPSIVLVHGAWADGSSWSGVIERLQADGYHVTAPQFPLTSLADDVARLRQVLDLQDGPTIIAGHSYGGQIITALGTDAPNAAGLVYVAAFGIDEGESLGALLSQGPTPPALAHLFTDSRGFGWLPEDDYLNHFAADVDPARAKVMHATQQALAGSSFTDVMGIPAWKSLPCWYLVATQDQAIPPDAERAFASRMEATAIEVPSSHVAMVSHPDEVTRLIVSAAVACAVPAA